MDVCKVFDERLTGCCPTVFAETQSDAPIEMSDEEVTSTESVVVQLFDGCPQTLRKRTIKEIVEINGCDNDAKNEDKNDKEEIVTIRDEPIEFVIANAYEPSLWINSLVSIPYDLVMFDIHKTLDDRWNQLSAGHSEKFYPQHGLELPQCWEEMSYFPSTWCYAKIITKGITGHFSRLGHDALIVILNLFPPEQFRLEFPFDPGSSLLTRFLKVTRNSVFCAVSGDLNHDKFILSIVWNYCNWVDTGQGRNLYGFSLSNSRELGREEKTQVLEAFVARYLKQLPNILVKEDDVLLFVCGVCFFSVYLVVEKVSLTTKLNDEAPYVWEYQVGCTLPVMRDTSGENLRQGKIIGLVVELSALTDKVTKDIASNFHVRLSCHKDKLFDRSYRRTLEVLNSLRETLEKALHRDDHVKDIIKWVVGGTDSNAKIDLTCWQWLDRANYPRSVSFYNIITVTYLAKEMGAAVSRASLVLKDDDNDILEKLVQTIEKLFILANNMENQEMYAPNDDCGGEVRQFYNLSSYIDDLVLGGIWLCFAPDNNIDLKHALHNITSDVQDQVASNEGVFYWSNKVTAISILLTRISTTKGALILFKSSITSAALQYVVTTSFLSKLYGDYLKCLISIWSDFAFIICLMEMLPCHGKIAVLELERFTILQASNAFTKLVTKESSSPYFPQHGVHQIEQMIVELWFEFLLSLTGFTALNFEDKVLIGDGGIVVNQTDYIRAYGLEGVNETGPVDIIGPIEMLEGFIWDPGPIINWLNRT